MQMFDEPTNSPTSEDRRFGNGDRNEVVLA
ncbi:uncharacterized protein HVO_A0276A (plasmid) [Haloferax volcanii DS2]|uniref:Uncharacterized protein n=1 Tax=Haloferax volcanii (strain ATCC 29605 / DSM 3757 / JCM 8879 / NBRC 14742 / NCIMB 2012 / VKM B-1768 / DS2) TaxID=309800 RepID=A0A8E8PJ78_HALVD|nr:uncharacterized protein HVO_A0276A [Haloferax volcanii DS2]